MFKFCLLFLTNTPQAAAWVSTHSHGLDQTHATKVACESELSSKMALSIRSGLSTVYLKNNDKWWGGKDFHLTNIKHYGK